MNNYAYITLLLDNPDYINGVLLLRESLTRVKSKYPLYVCITDDIPEGIKDILVKAEIKTIVLDKIDTPDNIYKHNKIADPMRADIWKHTFTKFGVFSLTQFDKIIFCDSDLMFYKNVDHCFDLPHMSAALDGEYFNLWPSWPHFNSGFMVIKPEEGLKDDLMNFVKNLSENQIKTYRGGNTIIADQDILNLYYNDWPQRKELHLDKWYNVFSVHTHHNDYENIIDKAYFVHFNGTKPWQNILDKGLNSLVLHDYKVCGEENSCIANSIIDLSYKNTFKPLDWDKLEESGTFYQNVAEICVNCYRNYDLALKYVNKSLNMNPNNIRTNMLKENIELTIKGLSLKPIIKEIYDKLYMEALKDGECMFPYYFVDQIYGPVLEKDSINQINLTLETWAVIKKAIYAMMDEKYNGIF